MFHFAAAFPGGLDFARCDLGTSISTVSVDEVPTRSSSEIFFP